MWQFFFNFISGQVCNTSSRSFSDGNGFRNLGTRYEQRELRVNQIHGSHRLGFTTRDIIGFDALPWLTDLEFNWYVSDATTDTEIPNESRITFQTTVDAAGNVLTQSQETTACAGSCRASSSFCAAIRYR